MLKQYSQKEIEEIFNSLPKELQETIVSVETANKIKKIASENQLNNIQANTLAKCIGRILMGLLKTEYLTQILQAELKIDNPKANRISQQIIRLIIAPVQTFIREKNAVYKNGSYNYQNSKITPSPEQTKPIIEGNIVDLSNNKNK